MRLFQFKDFTLDLLLRYEEGGGGREGGKGKGKGKGEKEGEGRRTYPTGLPTLREEGGKEGEGGGEEGEGRP
jgi:hypothetical protein